MVRRVNFQNEGRLVSTGKGKVAFSCDCELTLPTSSRIRDGNDIVVWAEDEQEVNDVPKDKGQSAGHGNQQAIDGVEHGQSHPNLKRNIEDDKELTVLRSDENDGGTAGDYNCRPPIVRDVLSAPGNELDA